MAYNNNKDKGNNYGSNKGFNNRPAQGNYQKPAFPPAGYLQGYYEDPEKLVLKKEYILSFAKDIKNTLEAEGGANRNKRSQIRKFYDYCIRIRDKLDTRGDFSYVAAEFANLDPMASIQKSRNVVSESFYSFISSNVEAVKDERDFRAFVMHFQAIVAYMKKDEGGR